MGVRELLERMDSREIEEWRLLFLIKAEEAEIAEHGDVIEHGRRHEPGDDDGDEDDDDEEAARDG